MSSDPARLALYNRLGEVLGPEHAATMMRDLPDQSAAPLATKADTDRMKSQMDGLESRMDRLESRFDRVEETLREYQRTYVVALVGAMTAQTAIIGLIVGVVR